MSSDEVKDFVENVSDAITKNPNDKKEENLGVIVANKIPDTRLKVHIGNRDGIMSEQVIYYAPTGEPAWNKTLRYLKHIYDPSLSGATQPQDGDGFEEGQKHIRTSDDVKRIYEIYLQKLKKLSEEEETIQGDQDVAKGIQDRSGGKIKGASGSVVDDYEDKLNKIRGEKRSLGNEINKLNAEIEKLKANNQKELERLMKEIQSLKDRENGIVEFLSAISIADWQNKYKCESPDPEKIKSQPLEVIKRLVDCVNTRIQECMTLEERFEAFQRSAGELAGNVQTANPTINIYNTGDTKDARFTDDDFQRMEEEMQRLINENDGLNDKLRNCEERLRSISQEFRKTNSENVRLRTELDKYKNIEKELRELKEKWGAENIGKTTAQNRMKELTEMLRKSNMELERLKTEIERLGADLDRSQEVSKTESNSKDIKLKQQLNQIEQMRKEFEIEMRKKREECEARIKEIQDKLQEENNRLQEENNRINEELRKCNEELEQLKKSLQEKESSSDVKDGEISKLREQITRLESKKGELDKQIEEIKRQVEDLRISIEEEKVHDMTSREKDDAELIDLMRAEGEKIMIALTQKIEDNNRIVSIQLKTQLERFMSLRKELLKNAEENAESIARLTKIIDLHFKYLNDNLSEINSRLDNISENLRLKLKDAQGKLGRMTDRDQQISSEIEILRKQIIEIEKKGIEADAEKKDLNRELERLRQAFEKLTRQKKECENKIRELTSEISVLKAQNVELNNTNTRLSEESNYGKQQIITLNLEIRKRVRDIQTLEDKISESERKQEEENEITKNLIMELREERRELIVELKNLKEQMQQLTDQNKSQEDKLRQLEEENRKQLARIEELSRVNDELRERMRKINTDSEGKNNEIGRLTANIDELKDNLRAKISENRGLTQQIADDVEKHDSGEGQLRKREEEIRRLTVILNEIIGILQITDPNGIKDKIVTIIKEKEQIAEQILQMKRKLDNLHQSEGEKERKIEEDKSKIDELQNRLRKCEEELRNMQDQLDSFTQDNIDWDTAYKSLQEETEQRIKDIQIKFGVKISQMSEEMTKLQEDTNKRMMETDRAFDNELTKKRDEIKRQSGQIREQEKEIIRLNEENKRLREENAILQEKIIELNRKLTICKEKLLSCRQEIENINQEMSILKREEAEKAATPSPPAPQAQLSRHPTDNSTQEARVIIMRQSTVSKEIGRGIEELQQKLNFWDLKDDESKILYGMKKIKIIDPDPEQAFGNALETAKMNFKMDDAAARNYAIEESPSLFHQYITVVDDAGVEEYKNGVIALSDGHEQNKKRLVTLGFIPNFLKQHSDSGSRVSVLAAIRLLLWFAVYYRILDPGGGVPKEKGKEITEKILEDHITDEGEYIGISIELLGLFNNWIQRMFEDKWPFSDVERRKREGGGFVTHMRGSVDLFKLELEDLMFFLKQSTVHQERIMENLNIGKGRRRTRSHSPRGRRGGRRTLKKKRNKKNKTLKKIKEFPK
jgi:chromosome segregation ATPase